MASDKSGVVHHVSARVLFCVKEERVGVWWEARLVVVVNGNGGSRNPPPSPPSPFLSMYLRIHGLPVWGHHHSFYFYDKKLLAGFNFLFFF